MRLIECTCAEATIEQRLQAGNARSAHLADNRNIQLYRQLQAGADPIPEPKLRLNTEQPLHECADRVLYYVNHPLPTDPGGAEHLGINT